VTTVLIVEPGADLRELWAETLRRNGHDVLEVANVTDGVVRAREGGLDMIVVDAAAGDIRDLVAELERLPDAPPLVLVSDSPQAPELSAQIGAAGFLPKPCTGEDLVEIVGRVSSAIVRGPRGFDDETTSPRKKDF
jgi:DNA-binding NtrC family response regulator